MMKATAGMLIKFSDAMYMICYKLGLSDIELSKASTIPHLLSSSQDVASYREE